MKRKSVRAITMLLAAVLLCIAANAAAFLIDTQKMREHAWQGALMLCEEEGKQMVGGFKSAQLDNYTAVLILKTAAYVGEESLLVKTLGGLRVDMPVQEGQSEWEAFCSYEFGENSPEGGLSYSRYWHGYTLPLRLLLCILNLSNIQMLMSFAQLAMLFALFALLCRRGLAALFPGFLVAFFLLMPAATGVCLQYMPVTMLMLCASLAILLWDEAIDRAVSLPGFFALTGLFTNYFDLLTFPLVSLVFPLVILLCLRMKRGDSLRALFFLCVLCGFSWAFGYGGMWALKWLLTACAFGFDMLSGIFAQIFLRASSDSGSAVFSRLDVLKMNLDVILSKSSYLLILAAGAAASLLPSAKRMLSRRALRADLRAAVLLLPVCAVVLWYLVMANHSYDHTYFTYRSLAGAVFALYALLASFLPSRE